MGSFDLFKPLGGTRLLPLINPATDNFGSELVGQWRVIKRYPVTFWSYSDLEKDLQEFELVEFNADGTYHFPFFQHKKNQDVFYWKVGKKNKAYYLYAELNPYSFGGSDFHTRYRDVVLYTDGNVIVLEENILIRENEIPKYLTMKNLLGYISSLLIMAYDRMQFERNELLKDCNNSLDKANEYMRMHSNEILYSLMPRFETFKFKFFGWLDNFKDSPLIDNKEEELEIQENFVNSWVIKSRKKFSENDLSMIESATIVRSQYPDGRDAGKSVYIKFNGGGYVNFKLSESSKLEVGDSVDLEKAYILTWGKDREGTRNEIEVEP